MSNLFDNIKMDLFLKNLVSNKLIKNKYDIDINSFQKIILELQDGFEDFLISHFNQKIDNIFIKNEQQLINETLLKQKHKKEADEELLKKNELKKLKDNIDDFSKKCIDNILDLNQHDYINYINNHPELLLILLKFIIIYKINCVPIIFEYLTHELIIKQYTHFYNTYHGEIINDKSSDLDIYGFNYKLIENLDLKFISFYQDSKNTMFIKKNQKWLINTDDYIINEIDQVYTELVKLIIESAQKKFNLIKINLSENEIINMNSTKNAIINEQELHSKSTKRKYLKKTQMDNQNDNNPNPENINCNVEIVTSNSDSISSNLNNIELFENDNNQIISINCADIKLYHKSNKNATKNTTSNHNEISYLLNYEILYSIYDQLKSLRSDTIGIIINKVNNQSIFDDVNYVLLNQNDIIQKYRIINNENISKIIQKNKRTILINYNYIHKFFLKKLRNDNDLNFIDHIY